MFEREMMETASAACAASPGSRPLPPISMSPLLDKRLGCTGVTTGRRVRFVMDMDVNRKRSRELEPEDVETGNVQTLVAPPSTRYVRGCAFH